MKPTKVDVLIIGAGLTGLLLAYRLKQKAISFKIIEARHRIGGRIHTKLDQYTQIEMGATWFGTHHNELLNLLHELSIPIFEQSMSGITLFESLSTAPPQQIHVPENQPPSYRIQGGTHTLINTLASYIDTNDILLNEIATQIEYNKGTGFKTRTKHHKYESYKVVSTLPPMLLVNSIQCIPKLPDHILSIANNTHTWMGDAIKFGLSFKTPFWKNKNFSGAVFSNVGPVTELYDHTNHDQKKFALKGFLKGEMHLESKENRVSKVLHQLQKLFDDEILSYTNYEETLWRNEPQTYHNNTAFIFPHQNNGHAYYQQGYFDDNFYITGSETSPTHGGYMEGAIRSTSYVLKKLV